MNLEKIRLLFLIFFIPLIGFTQSKKVAFTYDDLPFVAYRHNNFDFKLNKTKKLLEALKKEKVPAIGFVNENKLFKNGEIVKNEKDILHLWLQFGNDLGNHSYSHLDFNTVSLKQYSADVLKGEIVSKEICRTYRKDFNYFRHPYLRTGYNKERSDSLSSFLKKEGYKEAPVTIDNSDYLFAYAYDSVLISDEALALKVGLDYIKYMEQTLVYYENQSLKLFGREIDQILLLHANTLNADFCGELIKAFRNHNYNFSTIETVLKDPAYSTPITSFGNRGISWIDRWALSIGKTTDFFASEPKVPDYILLLAKAKKK